VLVLYVVVVAVPVAAVLMIAVVSDTVAEIRWYFCLRFVLLQLWLLLPSLISSPLLLMLVFCLR
jgi:hypothetical protein